MKCKRLIILLPIICIITFLLSNFSFTANALDPISSDYTFPSDEGSFQDLFNFRKDDLGDPIKWLKKSDHFVVIEENDWKNHPWMNVPNIQGIVFGKLDGIFACGYTECGVDMDELTKNAIYKTDKNGSTAMKQLGFQIPSITYKGEYPVVEYDISCTLPNGVWGTIKSAIRFLFGGSITEAPSTDDMDTLNYINLKDYIEDYSTANWIILYWNSTCSYFETNNMKNQGLLPESICGNKESKADGKYYTVDSCIFNRNLNDPASLGYDLSNFEGAVDFNRYLKSTYGQYYSPIMTSIIYYSRATTGSHITQYSLRYMPYDAEKLSSSTKIKLDLVSDPRCDADAYFNLVHQKDNHFIMHSIWCVILNFFAGISQFTWLIDQFTKIEILEAAGININFLWENPILVSITFIFIIFFVFHTVKYTFRLLRGNMSTKEALIKTICGALMSIFLFALIINPGSTYDIFKKVVKLPSTLAASAFSGGTTATFISSSASPDDKYEINYWIPYYEMWSKYNTNHSLSNENQLISSSTTGYEATGIGSTYIGSDINDRWDLTLSYAFSSGYEVKRDAYRVIDHYLSPRFDVSENGGIWSITTTKNENFNGDIQETVGANWMIIIDLLIAELVKVFLFVNMVSQFAFLIIFIIFRYKEEGVANLLKSFGFGILLYFIATFLVPLVASFTYYGESDFINCLVLSVLFILTLVGSYKFISRSPDWMQPMLMVAIKQKKWRR